jgi:nicotinamide phosphoribosyltransferase
VYGGRLPVTIRALPEGTLVNPGIPLVTVTCSDKNLVWLPSYLETVLLRVWYPTTVATLSKSIKEMLWAYAKDSGATRAELLFKLHDFGSRGVSSSESAGIGGLAHLVNFLGTDTVQALVTAHDFYSEPKGMAGFSIPATEHSTITSWGKSRELDAYRNFLDQYGSGAAIACVSDSYDLETALSMWTGPLADQVRTQNATLVVRPDSGDPLESVLTSLYRLRAGFGSETNNAGYHVLNKVRVIQGDGVNYDTIQTIAEQMLLEGFSLQNITFGMGGALLQRVDRDTLSFAMKCCAVYDGKEKEWRGVNKQPAGHPEKNSKAGVLATYVSNLTGEYMSGTLTDFPDSEWREATKLVFYNGALFNDQTLKEVRARAGF